MGRLGDGVTSLHAAYLHPAARLPETASRRFRGGKTELPRRAVDHRRRIGGIFRQSQRGRHPNPDEISPHRIERFHLRLRRRADRIFRGVYAHLPLCRPHHPSPHDRLMGAGLLHQSGFGGAVALHLHLHEHQHRDDDRSRPRRRGPSPHVQLRGEQFCEFHGAVRHHGKSVGVPIPLSVRQYGQKKLRLIKERL